MFGWKIIFFRQVWIFFRQNFCFIIWKINYFWVSTRNFFFEWKNFFWVEISLLELARLLQYRLLISHLSCCIFFMQKTIQTKIQGKTVYKFSNDKLYLSPLKKCVCSKLLTFDLAFPYLFVFVLLVLSKLQYKCKNEWTFSKWLR